MRIVSWNMSGCRKLSMIADSVGFIYCCHDWRCLRKSRTVSESPFLILSTNEALAIAI